MKRRNREVNIFSVSLLDILCGALGAFCFFTIVLMPYYKPQSADAKELLENQNEMQREMDALRRELAKSPAAKDLLERLEKLQRRVQEMQGELNRKTQQLQQSEQDNQRLRARNPVVAMMSWTAPVNLDLYARGVPLNGVAKAEAVDASKEQFYPAPGDTQAFVTSGPGREVFLARDSPSTWLYEIYYKHRGGAPGPVDVTGFYMNEGSMLPMPSARLSGPGAVAMVGKIRPVQGGVARFEPAPAYAESYRTQLADWLRSYPGLKLK